MVTRTDLHRLGNRSKWRIEILRSFAALSFAVLASSRIHADDLPIDQPYSMSEPVNGQICGLLCVKAGVEAESGTKVPINDLLSAKYLSGPRGSTAEDLVQAIHDSGLHGVALQNANVFSLRQFRKPAILHVAESSSSSTYDHWVLYLGEKNGEILIADYPSGAGPISDAELAAKWDGTAVLIASESVAGVQTRFSSLFAFSVPAIAIIALTLMAIGIWMRSSVAIRMGNTNSMGIAVLTASIVLVALRHGFVSDGFLGNERAVRSVCEQHSKQQLMSVQAREHLTEMVDDESIFVDARSPQSFLRGHLPRAINLPMYAKQRAIRSILADVNPNRNLVIYCQNPRCGYADVVARSLRVEGFQNLIIYEGGWEDWNRQPEKDDS